MTNSELRRRWLLFAVCALVVATPYLVVTFPPTTDLPQHVAQIRLFEDVLLHHDSAYRIQWNTPYVLGYVPLGIFYYLFGPLAAGRLALMAVAVAWTAAAHYLAARRGLPAAAAVLATVFVFNHTFYWGLFSFVFGWPIFVVWLLLTTEPDREDYGVRDGLKIFATALLLFYSHAFWFAAAVAWLVVSLALERPRARTAVVRAAATLPVMALAVVWYVTFSSSWYAESTVWYRWPWTSRFQALWWVNGALGGIEGTSEYMVLGVVVAWIAVGLVARKRLGAKVNVPLAACAVMFLAVGIFAPYNYQNTIFFGERWIPLAFTLAVLAVPVPLPNSKHALLAAGGILAVLGLTTALLWSQFEAIEATGLEAALEAVPQNSRLIGLDFIRLSSVVRNEPFMQMAGYAQAMRGASLNFSFAEYPQSPVVYNVPGRYSPPWTRRLEWHPDLVRPSDFEYFDYALINTDDGEHARLPQRFPLTPATTEGRWRLYKVAHGS